MKCPRCNSDMVPTESFLGGPCPNWLECPNCNTYLNLYKPMPHQEALHRCEANTVGNFGGYGTGKTTTSKEEILKHALITNNAQILIGAAVTSQYDQTLRRDLEMDLPLAFVKDWSAQKSYIDLKNGARIMYRPYDDEGKIRSYTVTLAVILEASEVKQNVYDQITARTRGLEATVQAKNVRGELLWDIAPDGTKIPRIAYDWRKIIAESNPDSGWIRNEILLRSSKIMQFGVGAIYDQNPDNIVKSMQSIIAATRTNYRLPKGFEEDLRAKHPDWWQKRYLDGSFEFSEGLVYPNAMKNLCARFPIPKHWKRVVAFDYGLSDEAVFVFLAIDERLGRVYAYKVAHANNRNIEALAQMYHRAAADIPSGGLLTQPIIDPKSGPKRDYDMVSLSDKFLQYNINFRPGVVDVNTRVMTVNTYIEQGKLWFFDDLDYLLDELREYKFKPRTDGTQRSNKPMDVNNHGINALEWAVCALPRDPRQLLLEAYGKGGVKLSLSEAEAALKVPWQFADDPDEGEGSNHRWY